MPMLQGPRPGEGGPTVMLCVLAFAFLSMVLFGLFNSFHVHGWRSYAMAFVAAALCLEVGRAVIRRVTAAIERERRAPRPSRGGNRAERREKARRHR